MMLFIRSIHTTYSFWLILICLIISGLATYLLYRKDQVTDEIHPLLLWMIKILRFLFIFFVSFLLLKPLIKSLSRNIQEPIIVFAQDNTSSIIANADSTYYLKEYPTIIQETLEKLKKADVKSLAFDSKLYDNLSFDFSGQSTNLSNILKEVNDRYFNQNIGALIVATDGIYNEGVNPNYFRNGIEYPVFFIALGDTSKQRDFYIKKALYNNIVFHKNKFPVKVEVSATNLLGTNGTLRILYADEEILTKPVQINSNDFIKTFDLELLAEELGVQEYEIVLSNIENEQNKLNNRKTIVIDVIDSKTNVLLLYNSPHPDITAIRSTLAKNENYSFEAYTVSEFNKNIQDFDLIILHQLPSVNASMSNYIKQINDSKKPVLFILGQQTSIKKFNSVQSGLRIMSVRSNSEEAQGSMNKNFTSFSLNEKPIEILESFPPLNTILGSYQINNQGNILLFQRIKNIKTANPLIYFSEFNEHKTGFITGEGLWRWKLHNYKLAENQEVFDQLMNKTIQYLTLNVKKDRLNIDIEKAYPLNQSIIIDGELYNKNFELVNDPELRMILTSDTGVKYEYVFDKTIRAYELKIAGLEAGKYSYIAETQLGNERFSKSGEFIVYEKSIELMQTQANFKLLNQLAEKYNGAVFYTSEIEKIPEILNKNAEIKPTISYDKKLNDLINIKALLIILIAFISVEWFIRKYFGGY